MSSKPDSAPFPCREQHPEGPERHQNVARQKLLSGTVYQKNSRRLELSISKNTPHGRWGQGPGSVDPRFLAGLPFPVPEILEFIAFRDPGNFFQQFSRDWNPRTDPGNSHSLLEFSECSAIGVSVAATPPCSAIRLCKELFPRHNGRGVAR